MARAVTMPTPAGGDVVAGGSLHNDDNQAFIPAAAAPTRV
jgi:hypothetical protein